MTGPTEPQTLRFRPVTRRFTQNLRVAMPVIGVLLLVEVIRSAIDWTNPGGAVLPALAVLLVGVAAWASIGYLRHASVTVTPTNLVRVGAFGRRHVSARADLERTVVARLKVSGIGTMTNLIVLTRDRHRALRLTDKYYAGEDLSELASALGLPIDAPRHPMSARELNEHEPGSVRWDEVHPVLMALLCTLAVLAVAIALAVIVF